MTKIIKVRSGSLKADYSVRKPPQILEAQLPSLPSYEQQDYHSCGFIAALTVARYFRPGVRGTDVLSAIRPLVGEGTSQKKMINGLGLLGITVEYRDNLSIPDLYKYIIAGIPVIITVWPDDWVQDHWTVVIGFSNRKVYLVNHYSMTIEEFHKEWIECWKGWTTGAGLICSVSH